MSYKQYLKFIVNQYTNCCILENFSTKTVANSQIKIYLQILQIKNDKINMGVANDWHMCAHVKKC